MFSTRTQNLVPFICRYSREGHTDAAEYRQVTLRVLRPRKCPHPPKELIQESVQKHDFPGSAQPSAPASHRRAPGAGTALHRDGTELQGLAMPSAPPQQNECAASCGQGTADQALAPRSGHRSGPMTTNHRRKTLNFILSIHISNNQSFITVFSKLCVTHFIQKP